MRLTLFRQERGNRHGHGQVGFAGTRRTNAEHQIVALDGVDVAPLHHALRRDHFLAEGALFPALDQTAQGDVGVHGHHAQEAVQIAVVEGVALAHQGDVVVQDLRGPGYAGLLAFDFQGVIQQPRADVQAFFDQADILVSGPEQGLNAAADLDDGLHSRRDVLGPNFVGSRRADIRGRGGRNNIHYQHIRCLCYAGNRRPGVCRSSAAVHTAGT